jgi:predicted nuclease of predicted toxin-antitoxin system
MEQIEFYLDEHIHSAVAEGLRRRGVNVLTVQAAGRTGMSDREQLAFALSEGRVMVTMDSDFPKLTVEGSARRNRLRESTDNNSRTDKHAYAVARCANAG